MARDIDMKMNGSKQHVVLGLLLLVLSVGYTSGSRLSSSSMLAAQQEQENVTQINVATEQVQQECDEGGPCDEEGATSTNDCNNCYCFNGQWFCSNKICATNLDPDNQEDPDNEDPEIQEDPDNEDPDIQEDPDYDDTDYQEIPVHNKCVEDTKWTEECNTCECSFGHPLCTMKTCQECVHGSFWVDDCNTCECYEGTAECTTRKCLSDPVPICTEGSSWTEDCNTCFCSNGIVSCSKEICPAEPEVITTTQLPETTTKKCNGTIAGCYVMGGAKYAQAITKTIKIPSELNFCIQIKNGLKKYFAYTEKCYQKGKLACAYCENEVYSKYNPGTCKCHKPSRVGRKKT